MPIPAVIIVVVVMVGLDAPRVSLVTMPAVVIVVLLLVVVVVV